MTTKAEAIIRIIVIKPVCCRIKNMAKYNEISLSTATILILLLIFPKCRFWNFGPDNKYPMFIHTKDSNKDRFKCPLKNDLKDIYITPKTESGVVKNRQK